MTDNSTIRYDENDHPVLPRPETDAYLSWKTAVGLPEPFPRLEEIREPIHDHARVAHTLGQPEVDKRFYLGRDQSAQAQMILNSLANPFFAVQVPLGHGCTTLSRYIFSESSRNTLRFSRVPVRISLGDRLFWPSRAERVHDRLPALPSWGEVVASSPSERRRQREELADSAYAWLNLPGNVENLINNSLRESVVRSLVVHPWNLVIGEPVYGSLLGSESQALADIEAQRARLAPLVGPAGVDFASVQGVAPKLAQPMHDLLSELNERGSVRISLQIDLSPTPYGRWQKGPQKSSRGPVPSIEEVPCKAYLRAVEHVASALKNLSQLGAPIIPRVVDLALFLSPQALPTFVVPWGERPAERAVTAFAPTDVFSILWRHYPYRFEERGERTDLLSAVLDSRVLKRGIVKPTIALSTAVELLDHYLRERIKNYEDSTYQFGDDDDAFTEPITSLEEAARSIAQLRSKVTDIGAEIERVETALGELAVDGKRKRRGGVGTHRGES